MDPELLAFDDLPADAREILDAADQEEVTLRAGAEERIDQIRARAEQATAEIESRLDEELRARRGQLIQQLKPMQERYAREGKLDEALAIRERLRGLRGGLAQAQPDPGDLSAFGDSLPGSSLLFDVIGDPDGIVWGTDVYTGDSMLATAAVHAGALNPGERGLVRVTFVDTLNVAFVGSERRGVESHFFTHWPLGYRVQRA